jgi:hypothetical protein
MKIANIPYVDLGENAFDRYSKHPGIEAPLDPLDCACLLFTSFSWYEGPNLVGNIEHCFLVKNEEELRTILTKVEVTTYYLIPII